MQQLGSHRTELNKILYLTILSKIQVSLKSYKNSGHFTWKPMELRQYFAEFFLEREMFETEAVQNIRTLYVQYFFFENRAFY